jgi:hypothetical protein
MFDMLFQTAANGLDLLANGFMSFGKPLATLAIIAGATFLGFIVLSFMYKRIDTYLENKRKNQKELPPSEGGGVSDFDVKRRGSGGGSGRGVSGRAVSGRGSGRAVSGIDNLKEIEEFGASQEEMKSPSQFSSPIYPLEFRFHPLEQDVLRSYYRNNKKFLYK